MLFLVFLWTLFSIELDFSKLHLSSEMDSQIGVSKKANLHMSHNLVCENAIGSCFEKLASSSGEVKSCLWESESQEALLACAQKEMEICSAGIDFLTCMQDFHTSLSRFNAELVARCSSKSCLVSTEIGSLQKELRDLKQECRQFSEVKIYTQCLTVGELGFSIEMLSK